MDVAVVGGGIVGLATGLALRKEGRSVLILEAEKEVARHQTGHNSGVVHSGLYYRPGSLKAATCVAGRRSLERLCAEDDLPYERCGKVVVATREEELPALDELERRGNANGLEGLERLSPSQIEQREPAARGIAGLWVPETGIVDYRAVAGALARRLARAGAELLTDARVVAVRSEGAETVLETAQGEVRCGFLVGCAGLASDRLARLSGVEPGVEIVPFRGDYYELVPEKRDSVKGLIYPVPDPELPFLGVHLTRRVDGSVEAGPNAVLALSRTGYGRFRISPRDAFDALTYPGTWRLAARFWRTGVAELGRSLSRVAFARALARLMPDLGPEDIRPAGCGIRAQAVDRAGRLVDDFRLARGERSLHVVNAPSPAATASLAIGRRVAAEVIAAY